MVQKRQGETGEDRAWRGCSLWVLGPVSATPLPTSKTWARSGCHKYLCAELMFALAGQPGKTGGGEGHLGLSQPPCEPKTTKICKVYPDFISKLGFGTAPSSFPPPAPPRCAFKAATGRQHGAKSRHRHGTTQLTPKPPSPHPEPQHPNAKFGVAMHPGEHCPHPGQGPS